MSELNFYKWIGTYKCAGADVKKTDRDGLTSLGWACLQGHRHAVVTLLDKGSSVNVVDKNGRTPLDLAATCSDPKIVQVRSISNPSCPAKIVLSIVFPPRYYWKKELF